MTSITTEQGVMGIGGVGMGGDGHYGSGGEWEIFHRTSTVNIR
ncbi:hypothetical protein QUA41_02925 [Microcoleus sp. Pol11C1]